MGDVINLNKFRKTRARAEAEARAISNRARFGLNKGEKTKQQSEIQKSEDELDGKTLE